MSEANPLRDNDPEDRLESWKEIAAYLRRGVRTVQRWERTEGLPVYRHHHDKRGTVYAFRHEINAWREKRKEGVGAAAKGASSTSTTGSRPPLASMGPGWNPSCDDWFRATARSG